MSPGAGQRPRTKSKKSWLRKPPHHAKTRTATAAATSPTHNRRCRCVIDKSGARRRKVRLLPGHDSSVRHLVYQTFRLAVFAPVQPAPVDICLGLAAGAERGETAGGLTVPVTAHTAAALLTGVRRAETHGLGAIRRGLGIRDSRADRSADVRGCRAAAQQD